MRSASRSILSIVVLKIAPLLVLVFLVDSRAEAKEPRREQLAFFEREVRPLFAEKCYRCHGPREQRSGLRLDSREALMKGGDSGLVVVPGQPRESALINAINYESVECPPDGKLSDGQIATLTRWVEMGASWPSIRTVASTGSKLPDDDRRHWAFQPIVDPAVPMVEDGRWCANPIDGFVYRKLEAERLSPAPAADSRSLIRRAYFDLIGLPPTPEEVEAFVRDSSPQAYEALIERLLSSPHYGERWGRHWLDLVRYAESDGHHQDLYRPEAWRYRDYVIRSFNQDKPFDRFILEQLAGDEIDPDDPDSLTATGYLRHWTYEGNQRKVDEVRKIILNDVTDVTGEVFLGLSIGCARCHDHKFDPILQEDYYRLQAFFVAMVPRDDVIAAVPEQRKKYLAQQTAWNETTAEVRRQIAELEAPIRKEKVDYTFQLFPQQIKDLCRKPASQQTPLEQVIYLFADRHMTYEQRQTAIVSKLGKEARRQWDELQKRLAELESLKPDPPKPMVVADIGPVAPITRIAGSERLAGPSFPIVLGDEKPHIERPLQAPNSTGRRTALARWIASPDHPLTPRVIVNRIWQYHFGRGLVATSNDFGRLGEPPTHPELLDWLASRFLECGWKFKEIHRLIMTSATYQQSALWEGSEPAQLKDPANRWLWRMNIRRLGAEQIRDAVLASTGELDRTVGGPSVEPSTPRRTIYLKVFRNNPNVLLRTFDAPDGFNSTAHRDVSTTSTQALLLMNGEWMLGRAEALALLLGTEDSSVEGVISRLYHLLYGRMPDEFELVTASRFLRCSTSSGTGESESVQKARKQAWVDFCHVLLNSNEFLYLD